MRRNETAWRKKKKTILNSVVILYMLSFLFVCLFVCSLWFVFIVVVVVVFLIKETVKCLMS